jgi:uroporphyrin-III C-methyltransferase/precorrin-2 dehydrogenase/sirohydrochlorin ferrochelatase
VSGFVSLVGAGPGDPGLLTRRAAQRLAQADLVLYDALVAPEVVALAPQARRFSVGKRAGRAAVAQEAIHRVLIRAARRGFHVVRLKGGDPFVFGRGGEEALALHAAGVPFEVVPGISSALAAPAAAGIPVTHRGLSSAAVVLTGHAEAAWRPVIDSLAPHAATLVVLMGLAGRGVLVGALLARGWRRSTPCAVVWAASRHECDAWRGALFALPSAEPRDGAAGTPGTIVIGDVVSLSSVLSPVLPSVLPSAATPFLASEGGVR